jgi:hypothetical protein
MERRHNKEPSGIGRLGSIVDRVISLGFGLGVLILVILFVYVLVTQFLAEP